MPTDDQRGKDRPMEGAPDVAEASAEPVRIAPPAVQPLRKSVKAAATAVAEIAALRDEKLRVARAIVCVQRLTETSSEAEKTAAISELLSVIRTARDLTRSLSGSTDIEQRTVRLELLTELARGAGIVANFRAIGLPVEFDGSQSPDRSGDPGEDSSDQPDSDADQNGSESDSDSDSEGDDKDGKEGEEGEDSESQEKLDDLEDEVDEALKEEAKKRGLDKKQDKGDSGFPPPHDKKMPLTMESPPGADKPQTPNYIITPPIQGWFRQSVLDKFDRNTLEWSEENNEVPYPTPSFNVSHTIEGKIRGKVALPLPKGFVLVASSIRGDKAPIQATFDPDHGTTYLYSAVGQSFCADMGFCPHAANPQPPCALNTEDIITGSLSAETEDFLRSIQNLPAREKATKIAEYTMQMLEYSTDEAMNLPYKADPTQYFQQIEKFKKGDCKVGNTFFVALCRRAGIAARMVNGYRIDGSIRGRTEIKGVGHAWSEIWDGSEWLTIDATPPGGGQNQGGGAGEQLDTNNPTAGMDLQPKKPDAKSPSSPPNGETPQQKKARELKQKIDELNRLTQQAGAQQMSFDQFSKQLEEIAREMEQRRKGRRWYRRLAKKLWGYALRAKNKVAKGLRRVTKKDRAEETDQE